MKLKLPLSSIPNEVHFLRNAGYHFHSDPRTGKESWSRRLGTEHYPRFHVYVKKIRNVLLFDLHLDQKKVSYKGSHAHAGEYDGSTVEREIERLANFNDKQLPSLSGVPEVGSVEEAPPKTFLDRFFK